MKSFLKRVSMGWLCRLTVIALGLVFAIHAEAQSYSITFESGTDEGFGHKFGDDASETFPVITIGGSQRMAVLRNGDFQEADRVSTSVADPFYVAMSLAAT